MPCSQPTESTAPQVQQRSIPRLISALEDTRCQLSEAITELKSRINPIMSSQEVAEGPANDRPVEPCDISRSLVTLNDELMALKENVVETTQRIEL